MRSQVHRAEVAMSSTETIYVCKLCGKPDVSGRWDLDQCLRWIEDCMRWIGHVLHGEHIHWCAEWDGLPVDETTKEYECCHCFEEPV